jgi:hypothetical protein
MANDKIKPKIIRAGEHLPNARTEAEKKAEEARKAAFIEKLRSEKKSLAFTGVMKLLEKVNLEELDEAKMKDIARKAASLADCTLEALYGIEENK